MEYTTISIIQIYEGQNISGYSIKDIGIPISLTYSFILYAINNN